MSGQGPLPATLLDVKEPWAEQTAGPKAQAVASDTRFQSEATVKPHVSASSALQPLGWSLGRRGATGFRRRHHQDGLQRASIDAAPSTHTLARSQPQLDCSPKCLSQQSAPQPGREYRGRRPQTSCREARHHWESAAAAVSPSTSRTECRGSVRQTLRSSLSSPASR
jgi:hypothetical protein